MSKKASIPKSFNAQALASEIKVTAGFHCTDGFHTFTAVNQVPDKPGYWLVSGGNSSGNVRWRHHGMVEMSEQELIELYVQERTGPASEPKKKPSQKITLPRILIRQVPRTMSTMLREAMERHKQSLLIMN